MVTVPAELPNTAVAVPVVSVQLTSAEPLYQVPRWPPRCPCRRR